MLFKFIGKGYDNRLYRLIASKSDRVIIFSKDLKIFLKMFADYIKISAGQRKTGVIKLKHTYHFKIRIQRNVTIFNKESYRKI